MKNVLKNKSIVLLGSLAGTCLLATVALANPSMLPDHQGYPMKESKSPVTGLSTANDPGQENLYGQNALNAATKEGKEDMKLPGQTGHVKGGNPSENQHQMSGQDQKMGQEHMTRQDQKGN
ncbi:MAG TPA: hypothetical protein PKK23_05925 [Nitrospirales bacterium]|nr:hypothetical protein [Nitrospirales bacterium]